MKRRGAKYSAQKNLFARKNFSIMDIGDSENWKMALDIPEKNRSKET